MDLQYCEKFGYDKSRVDERLVLVGLSEKDHAIAGRLQQEVIVPKFNAIVDQFFSRMLQNPEVKKLLHNPELIKIERVNQSKFLLSLGMGFDSLNYFEDRLRVGVSHSAAGLPISLYICAFQLLIQTIIDNFPATVRSNIDDYQAFMRFLLKITTLDMSLAIDTCFINQLKSFEQSLDGMQVLASHLEKHAVTDSLTGMTNHEHVFNELQQAINKAHTEESPLCVIMADIDHFKSVNDNYGHLAGDGVLKEVAKRIKNSLRGFDIVGRYGGEEFLLILTRADLQTARMVAERIRSRIAATPIDLPEGLLDITISMGVAMVQTEEAVNSLVDRADRALYNAKHNGRNQVALAE
ncbi:MAG: diguanylate cyclase [Gammaproteobacteria bacterium]|nr:diguanylate cyclase [Gammaproteobacteria bacterium]